MMEFLINIFESLFPFMAGFLDNEILPIAMQGAGIAGITFLISLFAIIYPKNEAGNAKEIIENHILLNVVFPIKDITIIIILIYAPFLFWDIESIKIHLFLISFLSIFILFYIIHSIIRWALAGAENDIDGDVDNDEKNYKNKLIKETLTSIEKSDKAPKFYAAFFGKKYSDNQIYIEEKYFNYFLEYLDKIYQKEKNQLSTDQYQYNRKGIFMQGLRTYNELMINRNLSNPYLLSHFTEKWIERFFQYYNEKDDQDGRVYIHVLVGIIRNHMKAYCKLDNKLEWSLLISLIKSSMKTKSEKIIIAFFKDCVIDIFLAEPKIWQRDLFPEEWKIKIEEKENIYALEWFYAFWNQSMQRPQDYDNRKESEHQQLILEGLFFDEIDPEIFSYFYRIIYPDYNRIRNRDIVSKNYMKWLVEEYKHEFWAGTKPSLYYRGGYSANESSSPPTPEKTFKMMNKRIKKMEQTAFKIFWGHFRYPSVQKPAVEEYINQLRQLSYDEEKNRIEFYRREILIRMFKKWLVYCKKKDKEKSVKQLVAKE